MQKITANVSQTCGFAVADHPLLFCGICGCGIQFEFAVPSTAKCKLHILKTAHWRTTGRAIFLLLPVSTIPWVIWLLALIGGDAVKYAFLVSSGLQGIAIFVIICVINKDDRARIRILWKTSRICERLRRFFLNVFNRALHRTKEENSNSNSANLTKTENHVENDSDPFELKKSYTSHANGSMSANSFQSSAKPSNLEKSLRSDANPLESRKSLPSCENP